MSKPETVDILASLGGNEFELDRTKAGAVVCNLNNAALILAHDPKLKGKIHYDDFLRRILTGDPPREWTDVDDIDLTVYLQRELGLQKIEVGLVTKAVVSIAHRHHSNCVRDYFESLTWDQEPRIEHFFEDHFGAEANQYTRRASRNFWISLAARIYQPGCQVDHMPVLEGSQGIGKSRALRVIGGPFYAEQHESASNPKAFAENLQGKLLVEVSEMDAFSRSEVTRVKQVITCTSDRYRGSYERHAQDHPRQCVFVGTTNRDDWNKDETGARRFWPIACSGEIDIPAIQSNRDQFFAEAVCLFKSGTSWWEMPTEETISEQEKRYDADIWLETIAEYLALKTQVTANEILIDRLKFEEKECDKRSQMRVTTCLRSLGWQKTLVRVGSKPVKVWRPPLEPKMWLR